MQHSYNITSLVAKGGSAYRAAVNAALQALASHNLGEEAAAVPYVGMLQWFDEAPSWTLKAYTGVDGHEWTDAILTVDTSTGAVTGQSALTLLALATGFSIAGGTTSKTLTVDTDITASNLMLVTGANLAVGSDADGDMYYRASSALARLAKGTANYRLFMDGAGNGPEWATGEKLGSFTIDLSTSGAQAITGVGFKPSQLELMYGIDNTGYFGVGWTDGTVMFMVSDRRAGTSGTYYHDDSKVIYYSDGTNANTAVLTSFDSDGFTITKTKTSSPTGTLLVRYRARR